MCFLEVLVEFLSIDINRAGIFRVQVASEWSSGVAEYGGTYIHEHGPMIGWRQKAVSFVSYFSRGVHYPL